MTTRKIAGYGWRPQLPDHRDFRFTITAPVTPPPLVDMRAQCPPVYDQGQLGSCTGNAIAGAMEFEAIKQGEAPVTPSRLFIYYEERVLEGTVNSDAGAEIRDGLKVVANNGVCPETDWPYNIAKFAHKPTAKMVKDAKKDKAIQYLSINNVNLQLLRICLAAGYPFVFGFTVYESFESDAVAKTGMVPMPGSKEQVLGGHAVLCVGYDDSKGVFIVRNSWGTSWGQDGYFTIPYAYLTNKNLASDFWTIRQTN